MSFIYSDTKGRTLDCGGALVRIGVSYASLNSLLTHKQAISPATDPSLAGTQGGSSVTTEFVFNLTENRYADLLTPGAAPSLTYPLCYFRHYPPSNGYLATSSVNDHLYYLGNHSGNQTLELWGPADRFDTLFRTFD